MMFSLLAFYYWCNRWVKPLEKWGQRIETMANESEFTIVGAKGTFEEQLSALERELKESRHSLRQMVASRTAALDELTTVDVVTQLWNRKGLENELSMELARTRREQTSFGLIWIDLGLNDGSELETNSEAFEQVLNKAGKGIGKAIRLYDRASRWEDDEFLVLVRAKHACNLEILAQRIKSCIYSEIDSEQDQIQFPRLSELAIGGAMICPGLTKKDALAMADRALYIAKEQGGDKIYIY
tara:strand:- start:2409 stop:3131 length:723 start_codon:yes stop_codon:yes gene_type:complete